jgi:hypothetical protein
MADFFVEDCIWTEKATSNDLVINFIGRHLVVKRCKFIKCGWSGAAGGCIVAKGFTGDLLFESITFDTCIAGSGSIYIENTVSKTVTFNLCSVANSNYDTVGCFSAVGGSTFLLNLFVTGCEFTDCLVKSGTGQISSKHPVLHVDGCTFQRCVAESQTSVGIFIFQGSTAAVNSSVVNCFFDNEKKDSSSFKSIQIEGSSGFLLLFNSTLSWDSSSSSTFVSVIETKNIGEVSMDEIKLAFGSKSTETDGVVCQFATVTKLSIADSEFESTETDELKRIALSCGGTVSLESCDFTRMRIGCLVAAAASLNIQFSRFIDLESYSILAETVECILKMQHTRFIDGLKGKLDAFISLGATTSTASLAFSCFQTTTDGKFAIAGTIVVTLEGENCFSHLEISDAIENHKSVVNETNCEKGDNHFNCDVCRAACATVFFSPSGGFTVSHGFGGGENFDKSEKLSESKAMTESLPFTGSNAISSSRLLSETSKISVSAFIPPSHLLSPSWKPESSKSFSDSDLSESAAASGTNSFSFTDGLSRTSGLTESASLTSSPKIEKSSVHSLTSLFEGSKGHSSSLPFSATSPFSATWPFSATAELSEQKISVVDVVSLTSLSLPPIRSSSRFPTRSISSKILASPPPETVLPEPLVTPSWSPNSSATGISAIPKDESSVIQETGFAVADDDSDSSLLVVVIVMLVVFVVFWAFLMYSESTKKKKDAQREEEGQASQQGSNKVKVEMKNPED